MPLGDSQFASYAHSANAWSQCTVTESKEKALDTTCGMFAPKLGLLGSIATLLYELFASF
jgi:hypothetical protein